MESQIKELVHSAQERKFTDFDSTTKQILMNKISNALNDKGYFDRLDKAKGESNV
jgi:hypothetical protein